LLLRYFQVAIHVDRQFDYLHNLENYISNLLGPDAIAKQIYRRESAAYLVKKGAHFRNLAWFFYSFVFPTIVVIAVIYAGYQEFFLALIPNGNKCYDILIAATGLIAVGYYSFRYGKPTISFPNIGAGNSPPPSLPPSGNQQQGKS
jgi:hypothetical protein